MLRSGSICISFLYKYLLSENETEEDTDSGKKLIKRANKLECLAETFQSYGGVLAKLSQIVCFSDQNNTVFSDCKPFSQKQTIEYFKNEFKSNPDFFSNIKHIDFNVYKSGSVGQIHKAINKDNEEIVIKVQYVGLPEQIKSDLYILDKLSSYLFHFADINNAMVDIKTKLYEELDYKIELSNHKLIYDLWEDNENIKIPKLIPELSTKTLLAMYFVNANSLSEFINNSTQENRNIIGMYIVDFIFTNMYKYNIFYSDIHYGNFLVDKDNKLYVMDFGCLNMVSDKLLNYLKNLHLSMINENKNNFYNIVTDMEIIKDDISPASKEYIYEYFKLQYTPFTSNNFEFTDEWLEKAVYKNTELMKEWKLPSNIVYLNKVPYGLFHVLTKLKLKGDFLNYFKTLL